MLVNAVEKFRFSNIKYKNIKKSGNKIIRILAKLKSQKLIKFRSRNLIKVQKNLKCYY